MIICCFWLHTTNIMLQSWPTSLFSEFFQFVPQTHKHVAIPWATWVSWPAAAHWRAWRKSHGTIHPLWLRYYFPRSLYSRVDEVLVPIIQSHTSCQCAVVSFYPPFLRSTPLFLVVLGHFVVSLLSLLCDAFWLSCLSSAESFVSYNLSLNVGFVSPNKVEAPWKLESVGWWWRVAVFEILQENFLLTVECFDIFVCTKLTNAPQVQSLSLLQAICQGFTDTLSDKVILMCIYFRHARCSNPFCSPVKSQTRKDVQLGGEESCCITSEVVSKPLFFVIG